MTEQEIINKVMATISKSDLEKRISLFESILKDDLMSGNELAAKKVAVTVAALYRTLNELK